VPCTLRQPNVVALRSISLHLDQVQQLLRDPQPLPNVATLEVRGSKRSALGDPR
jgi:hypothetical protein